MSVTASSVVATSRDGCAAIREASLDYPGWPAPARGLLVDVTTPAENKLYFIQFLDGLNLGNNLVQVALDNYAMFSDTNVLLVVRDSNILHSRIVSETPLRRDEIDDLLRQYHGASIYVASALYV